MGADPTDERPSAARGADLLDTPHAGPAAIRGGVMRLLSYVVGVGVTVISAALLFRHLGVSDGGRYVTVLALVATAGGLADIGLTSLGIREVAVRPVATRERLMRNLLGLRIVLSGVGMIGAVAFAAIASYPTAMVVGTVLASCGLIVQDLQGTLSIRLMVDLRLGWVALLDLARQTITAVVIVGLVIAGARLLPFFSAPLTASCVALALTAWLLRGKVPMRPSFEWSEWRSVLRDVLPFAVATAAGVVYFRLAIVMLSLIAGAHETGYFAAPFRVTEVLIVLPQLVVAGALPIFSRAARDDRERLAYASGRIFEAMLVLGAWVTLMLTLAASFVIDVVAGPKFGPAAGVLRIQAFTLLLVFGYTSWGFALLGLRRHREILLSTTVALAVNAAGVAILGSSHGARGAALATVIADVVAFLAYGWQLSRAGVPVRSALSSVPRVAVAAAPAAALWFTPFPDVAKAVLATLIYGAMVLLVRAIPDELLVEARKIGRSLTAR